MCANIDCLTCATRLFYVSWRVELMIRVGIMESGSGAMFDDDEILELMQNNCDEGF